ncbi:hypothetical protein FOA52_013242 [Chlamydomonas sp. UWO 241]|nr:hypothetical protein FOA52_013242 [Chlamydomonas sp. UWO 241]
MCGTRMDVELQLGASRCPPATILLPILTILAIAMVLCTPRLVGAQLVNPLAPSPDSRPPLLSGELEAPRPFTTCPQPPVVVVFVEGFDYYNDSQHSLVDEELKAKNDASVQPVSDLADGVSEFAAAYWGTRPHNTAAARCVVAWLSLWAKQGGMTGQTNNQGRNHIKFRLHQIAVAYLRVKEEPSLDPKHLATINEWLNECATRHIKLWYERKGILNEAGNLLYWGGSTVMAVGIASNDASLFDWGIRYGYGNFVKTINADGTLTPELGRGPRALKYHAFATAALTMAAFLGEANGHRLAAMASASSGESALAALVLKTVQGVRDPGIFKKLTRIEQERPKQHDCKGDCDLAALQIFTHLCGPDLDAWPDACTAAADLTYAIQPSSRQLLGGFTSYFFGRQVPYPPASSVLCNDAVLC